nr:hypothetical protein [Neolewinella litorea]
MGELIDGVYGVGPESLESRLFTEAEIPWDDIAFTSSAFTLRAYFHNRRQNSTQLHRSSFPDVGEGLR